jgi:hypothetical protein
LATDLVRICSASHNFHRHAEEETKNVPNVGFLVKFDHRLQRSFFLKVFFDIVSLSNSLDQTMGDILKPSLAHLSQDPQYSASRRRLLDCGAIKEFIQDVTPNPGDTLTGSTYRGMMALLLNDAGEDTQSGIYPPSLSSRPSKQPMQAGLLEQTVDSTK